MRSPPLLNLKIADLSSEKSHELPSPPNPSHPLLASLPEKPQGIVLSMDHTDEDEVQF
jgi:hypothetical protein